MLAAGLAVAYFLAARLSLALLTKPDGVAVFWPAAGVASGVLIAVGPTARWPVIIGAMAATIAANLLGDRSVWSAVIFAVCNAGEAVIVAFLIERSFGSPFGLDRLRQVLGLLAAAVIGAAISGVGGTIGYVLFHTSATDVATIWYHWFTSDALGVVTVAPILIGLASYARDPPPRTEVIEGLSALAALECAERHSNFPAAPILGDGGAAGFTVSLAVVACGPLQAGIRRGCGLHRHPYDCLDDNFRHRHFR